MRFLTNDDVDALVGPEDALDAVRSAFISLAHGGAAVHGRERTGVGDVKLSTLGAVLRDDGIVGAKVYSTVAGRFTFLVVLFSADDGRRLAILESEALTRLRTAATAVLAAQVLARPGPKVLTVFGAGVQATAVVAAHVRAFTLDEVRLVTRTPRSGLTATFADLGVAVRSTTDPTAALDGADLVATATRSAVPLFASSSLPAGVHVSALGSSRPDCAELDVDAYRGARVVVEWVPQAQREAGGLLQAIDAGILGWDDVAELADVVVERAAGRRSRDDRTVFQSTGIGLEDIALAAAVLRHAEVAGTGTLVGG